jgi:hypothetical protein
VIRYMIAIGGTPYPLTRRDDEGVHLLGTRIDD